MFCQLAGRMHNQMLLIYLLLAFATSRAVRDPDRCNAEHRLKDKLMAPYDRTSRPVMNYNSVVNVSVSVSLFHILQTRWLDELLQWNNSYHNLTRLWFPANKIWTPDITISNNADENNSGPTKTNAIVESNGHVLWMYPTIATTSCSLDVRLFPFDKQKCHIVFISWTYDADKVDLIISQIDKQTSYYDELNQQWRLLNISAQRDLKTFVCCKEPFSFIIVELHLQRRSTFYIINLIFPCLLIYSISFLGFYLPVQSNDKVNFEITILLALIVFLMVILDILPPTPDTIPLLGMFYGATMLMVSISLVMAVTVTAVHFRAYDGQQVPSLLRRLIAADLDVGRSATAAAHADASPDRSPLVGSLLRPRCALPVRPQCLRPAGPTLRFSPSSCPLHSFPRSTPTLCDNQPNVILEWELLALKLDRVFFYLFLGASVTMVVAMGLQIVELPAVQ